MSLAAGVGALTATTSSVWGRGFLHRPNAHRVDFSTLPSAAAKTIYAALAPPYPKADAPQPVVLGQHTLLFHGDDRDEAENVSLCVQQLDGVVVPPDAVFSYNDTVGERTEERGFRPGMMYVSGNLVPTIGGGVCIPATAVYNAALLADMDIVERYNHSGPVHYADPGLDAAVAFGIKDLKFRNTSGQPVVIRAAAMGDRLTIALVGMAVPGRRVVVERVGYTPSTAPEKRTDDATVPAGTPQVKQEARPGYQVTVVRTVIQNGRVDNRETMSRDVVAPLPRLVLVNPLDDPASPEAVAAKKKKDGEAAKASLVPDPLAAAGAAPAVGPDVPLAPKKPLKPALAPVSPSFPAPSQKTAISKPVEGAAPPKPVTPAGIGPTPIKAATPKTDAPKAVPPPMPTPPAAEHTVGTHTRGL